MTTGPAVRTGRYTADLGDRAEIVVLLIGMRLNRPWRVRTWWPVLRAMPRMLRELSADPGSGLLRTAVWPGRTILLVQYWESFEQLTRFARDPERSHLPAWRAFHSAVAGSGDVGVWHETYVVPARNVEAIHSDMPDSGLLAATAAVPATGRRRIASGRMGAGGRPAAPPS